MANALIQNAPAIALINKQAIIAAGLLDVVQIRIANIVREIDREEETLHKQTYIHVVNDKIQID